MASELLNVPEDKLAEVIRVIRAGLFVTRSSTSKETREHLARWCDDEEKYLKELAEEGSERGDGAEDRGA